MAIFWYNFWSNARNEAAKSALGSTGLEIECWLAKKKEGPVYKRHSSDSTALPKNFHLRVHTATPDGIAPPYSVRWSVLNEGHEAKEDGALEHDTAHDADQPYWTSTAYQGRHKMICEVIKNGVAVRRGEHIVRVASRELRRNRTVRDASRAA